MSLTGRNYAIYSHPLSWTAILSSLPSAARARRLVLTRDIKTNLEALLPQTLGGLAAIGRPTASQRESARAAGAAPIILVVGVQGRPRAQIGLAAAKRTLPAPSRLPLPMAKLRAAQKTGHFSLVGSGPGSPDLLTLRAVERLQEADVVFYDRHADEAVLELARRDIERVFVGKHTDAHAWPRERINAVIVAEAQKGRRVVRLRSGDLNAPDLAAREISAIKAAGIPLDIVPSVADTAAVAVRSIPEAQGRDCPSVPRSHA